jgi:ribosomal protein L11 methyltransferase
MSWNQLTVDVPDDLVDAVVGELSGDAVAGVWENESPHSRYTRLLLYFGPRSNLEKIQRHIRAVFSRSGWQVPRISTTVVEECDWTEEWKKSYTSFPVGNDFFVIPSWENPVVPHDRLPIRIDPGQAFGTGTHETTQLMIDALERWVEPDQLTLDVGTGSGILAIATRLLGAKKIIACDVDAVAVQVANANIQRNGEDGIWTFCGSLDAVKTHSVHLALGNLTADLVVDLFPEFDRVLKRHGIAILSGILLDQAGEIREVLRRFHFTIYEELTRGEWLALICEKHGA